MPDDRNRFAGEAEDIRPLSRRTRSEDNTSAEDRKAREAARQAMEDDE